MREQAEGTDGQFAEAAVGEVAELPAFLALGVLGGGGHLLHSSVPGEEAERGEEGESIAQGHGNNHRGCRSLTTGFWVRVKVTRGENRDSSSIVDALMKSGEELAIVGGEEGERDEVNQDLCLVWSGFKKIPRGIAHREDLVEPCSKGSKIGGVSGGRGVKVCTEQ